MANEPTKTVSPEQVTVETTPQTAIDMPRTGQALEKAAARPPFKYQPFEKTGSRTSLADLLQMNMQSLQAVLPKHITAERLIKTLMVATNRTPLLLECTQASVLETIQRAAELGLDLSGTLGEAYAVPFKNKVKVKMPGTAAAFKEVWVYQALLIPGYRGLAKLARQSGEIAHIEAECVRANDFFDMLKGSAPKLEFRPKVGGERGDAIGYYALAKFRDGSFQAEFMSVAEVEKIRNTSKGYDPKNPYGPWHDHFDEMARKTVFRRLAKWLPLSADKFRVAIEHDNLQFDLSGAPGAAGGTIEVSAQSSKAGALSQRLRSLSDGGGAPPPDAAGDEAGGYVDAGSPEAEEAATGEPAGVAGTDASAGQEATTEEAAAGDKAATPPAEEKKPAGPIVMAPEQVDRLRKLAGSAEVSWDAVQERLGGPASEYSLPNQSAADLEHRVQKVISELAKGAKPGGKGR